MNRNLLLALFCLLLGSSSLFASGASDFDQANRKFKAGDFKGAAADYETLLTREGPRASVFYNLGNCYQSLGNSGPAILAYERARLLTPRDPDLLANLALARKGAAAFEETGPYPYLDAALGYLSRNVWSWLVAGAAIFLGALALAWGITPPPRRWIRQSALFSAWLAILSITAGAAALYLRRDEASYGIVLSESAAVHLSPFEKAESLGTPGPGRIVHIRGKNAGFQYVEVPGTNLRGWLPEQEVAAITPNDTRK